ncbi:NAD-binding protein [candidate division WOR-3 bacterium]|nr:NAD-binding protein [candidate division WOR-3 bacterium]
MVKELHKPQAEPKTEIVIVTDREINEAELRKNKAYERVFFIRSDPILHYVLKASRVNLAKSVVILANEESPDPDANSALIALAIIKLCNTGPRPHIVTEAINHRKIEHLRDAGVGEVICATDYGLGLLAQCALHAKLSTVYNNLLSYR